MKRLMTLLAVLALLSGACGDGSGETTTVPPATSSSTTIAPTTASPTIVPPPTTVPSSTIGPTTIGPTTPPTVAPPPLGARYVSVYLNVDGFIAPVARPLEPDGKPELVALHALLAGPTPDEMSGTPQMWGIVDGATLRSVSIENGVATVDLSSEFNASTGTSGEMYRLAGLTFTLTELPEVDEVVVMIEGERIQHFGGHGWDITPSIDRDTFQENQGAFGQIVICEPAWWLPVQSPVTLSGLAVGFFGKVNFGLYDNDGLELAVGEADVVPTGYEMGDFEIEIPFDVEWAQLGSVMVWDGSQSKFAQANLVEHAVWLMPTP